MVDKDTMYKMKPILQKHCYNHLGNTSRVFKAMPNTHGKQLLNILKQGLIKILESMNTQK